MSFRAAAFIARAARPFDDCPVGRTLVRLKERNKRRTSAPRQQRWALIQFSCDLRSH
jgi:hypothetical protein